MGPTLSGPALSGNHTTDAMALGPVLYKAVFGGYGGASLFDSTVRRGYSECLNTCPQEASRWLNPTLP